MKNVTNLILVALLILFTKSSFAQNTGIAYIENPQVNGSVFSWELHFERTNDWTAGLLSNALGGSAASFNFNTLGLTNPSLIIEPGGPLDNANYPNVTVSIILNKCIVDIPFTLAAFAGTLPLDIKTKLLTVSMDIGNPNLTAGLSWDETNTAFLDNSDANIVTTLTGGSDIPLPVELVSFSAAYKNSGIVLNWKTATEINNYGFEIERKVSKTWEKISFINGEGNSNSPKEYSYVDINPIGGSKFQYRLKQIDNDGQFEYSDIVEVEFVPNKFELYQNYPNPFNPSTKIRYQLPTESKVVIKIYNILGSEVMELVNEQKAAGIYEVQFNAESLASGTYIYKISADNFVQTKKMILLK
jgi:hypothetical protein